MKKRVRTTKRIFTFLLVFLISINSFAAVVSDNDGSAFITKAEFDSLKNTFQTQIDQYNTSIDSKIDGAVAAYLAGIRFNDKFELKFPTEDTSSIHVIGCGGKQEASIFDPASPPAFGGGITFYTENFDGSKTLVGWRRGQTSADGTTGYNGYTRFNGIFEQNAAVHSYNYSGNMWYTGIMPIVTGEGLKLENPNVLLAVHPSYYGGIPGYACDTASIGATVLDPTSGKRYTTGGPPSDAAIQAVWSNLLASWKAAWPNVVPGIASPLWTSRGITNIPFVSEHQVVAVSPKTGRLTAELSFATRVGYYDSWTSHRVGQWPRFWHSLELLDKNNTVKQILCDPTTFLKDTETSTAEGGSDGYYGHVKAYKFYIDLDVDENDRIALRVNPAWWVDYATWGSQSSAQSENTFYWGKNFSYSLGSSEKTGAPSICKYKTTYKGAAGSSASLGAEANWANNRYDSLNMTRAYEVICTPHAP